MKNYGRRRKRQRKIITKHTKTIWNHYKNNMKSLTVKLRKNNYEKKITFTCGRIDRTTQSSANASLKASWPSFPCPQVATQCASSTTMWEICRINTFRECQLYSFICLFKFLLNNCQSLINKKLNSAKRGNKYIFWRTV